MLILVDLLFVFIFRPLIPYTLALFINYFSEDKTPESYRNAHIYNFLMNFLSILTALMLNHLQLSQGRVGMRVRIASCSLLYRKVSIIVSICLDIDTIPIHGFNFLFNEYLYQLFRY